MVTEIMTRENWGLLAVPNTATCTSDMSRDSTNVLESGMQCSLCLHDKLAACTQLQECLLCFPMWNIVTCILCMDFATAMHMLLLKNTKGVFPTEGFHLEVFLLVLTRHCVILAVFPVLLCGLKGSWYERLTHERTFLSWFKEVHVCPLVE